MINQRNSKQAGCGLAAKETERKRNKATKSTYKERKIQALERV